jgi:hypothetical protein
MPLYADSGGFVREAVSAYGYNEIISFNRNPMKEKYKSWNADDIIADYFGNLKSLNRGDIVYFRLDYFDDTDVLINLVENITTNLVETSTYSVKSVGELLANELVYIPKERRVELKEDELERDISSEELVSLLTERFIAGNPGIDEREKFVGFKDAEIDSLDATGRIDTNGEKVLFLSFDDWGSDVAITKLLNVLNKYDIKATFFVILRSYLASNQSFPICASTVSGISILTASSISSTNIS